MPESSVGEMPPEVAKEFEGKMKASGFMKFEDLREPLQMAFTAGSEAVLTHKTCEEPTCKHCELRRGIDEEGFKRGLEKGMALGAQQGAAQ